MTDIFEEIHSFLTSSTVPNEEELKNNIWKLVEGDGLKEKWDDYWNTTHWENQAITAQEAGQLAYNFARNRNSTGFTAAELQEIFDWAVDKRVGQSLLDLVLKDVLNIDWSKNEQDIIFSRRDIQNDVSKPPN